MRRLEGTPGMKPKIQRQMLLRVGEERVNARSEGGKESRRDLHEDVAGADYG